MNKRVAIDVTWNKTYYGQAIGMTIVGVEVTHDELDDAWTTLICERQFPDGSSQQFLLEISQDPEGNGPGFLFGLPSVHATKHEGEWVIKTHDGTIVPIEVTA